MHTIRGHCEMLPPACRCGIADWRGLRLALDLSQQQLAAHLGISVRQVQLRERGQRHICARPSVLIALHALLAQPDVRQQLIIAGYPVDSLHQPPGPQELAPSRRRHAHQIARACSICHVRLWQHPRCSICGLLAGPGHIVSRIDRGVCPICQTTQQDMRRDAPQTPETD